VGHLYRGIEDGFEYLTQKHGEKGLFVGPPDAQIAKSYFGLTGLNAVTDLASAVAAIQGIVEQGEGARGDSQDSHYGRFLAMQQEYERILQDDPKFEPGRPVLPNPYSLFPYDIADPSEVNLLDDPLSIDICNLFNGSYELLIQMLGRLLLHTEESEAQLALLSDITVGLMMDVTGPLGEALTTLPAGPSHPGLTAGPSFRFSRDIQTPPHQVAAWAVFVERLKELSAYCGFIQASGKISALLAQVQRTLLQYAGQLDES
jgi:hypothetical protein